jgi:CDP-diacylglycerol---glycerol-3-phosphate 3-phosphatidyltransferase
MTYTQRYKMVNKNTFNTIPNYITLFRILCIPAFIYFFQSGHPSGKLIAALIFLVASLSDLFDGIVARLLNQVTEIGVFLDQFADKLLVWPALFLFSTVDSLGIPLWFGIVIFARDIITTLLRFIVKKNSGLSMRTSAWGKWKSAIQMVTIIFILIYLAADEAKVTWLEGIVRFISDYSMPFWSMVVCLILTILSLIIYFVDNRVVLSSLRTKRP